eukprot:UN18852
MIKNIDMTDFAENRNFSRRNSWTDRRDQKTEYQKIVEDAIKIARSEKLKTAVKHIIKKVERNGELLNISQNFYTNIMNIWTKNRFPHFYLLVKPQL